MLSEKEKNIIQALVEDEITHVMNHEEVRDPLLNGYRRTLNMILLKLKMDDRAMFDIEYGNILDQTFLSRQAV